jgi:hypothetical protein
LFLWKTNKILSHSDSEEEGKKPQINKIQFKKVDIKKYQWNPEKYYGMPWKPTLKLERHEKVDELLYALEQSKFDQESVLF